MKTDKRKRYSEKEKTKLLAAYKASGLSQKQWSKENAIGQSTLQRWLKQERKPANSQPLPSWIPVIPTAPATAGNLEIQIGKCKLLWIYKTDKQLLTTVLGIVVQVC